MLRETTDRLVDRMRAQARCAALRRAFAAADVSDDPKVYSRPDFRYKMLERERKRKETRVQRDDDDSGGEGESSYAVEDHQESGLVKALLKTLDGDDARSDLPAGPGLVLSRADPAEAEKAAAQTAVQSIFRRPDGPPNDGSGGTPSHGLAVPGTASPPALSPSASGESAAPVGAAASAGGRGTAADTRADGNNDDVEEELAAAIPNPSAGKRRPGQPGAGVVLKRETPTMSTNPRAAAVARAVALAAARRAAEPTRALQLRAARTQQKLRSGASFATGPLLSPVRVRGGGAPLRRPAASLDQPSLGSLGVGSVASFESLELHPGADMTGAATAAMAAIDEAADAETKTAELLAALEGVAGQSMGVFVEKLRWSVGNPNPVDVPLVPILRFVGWRMAARYQRRKLVAHLLLPDTQAVARDMLWYAHCRLYRAGTTAVEQEVLLQRVASRWVRLHMTLARNRDLYFEHVPFAVADAVYAACFFCMAGSRNLFDASFRARLFVIVVRVLVGADVSPITVLLSAERYFPDEAPGVREDEHKTEMRRLDREEEQGRKLLSEAEDGGAWRGDEAGEDGGTEGGGNGSGRGSGDDEGTVGLVGVAGAGLSAGGGGGGMPTAGHRRASAVAAAAGAPASRVRKFRDDEDSAVLRTAVRRARRARRAADAAMDAEAASTRRLASEAGHISSGKEAVPAEQRRGGPGGGTGPGGRSDGPDLDFVPHSTSAADRSFLGYDDSLRVEVIRSLPAGLLLPGPFQEQLRRSAQAWHQRAEREGRRRPSRQGRPGNGPSGRGSRAGTPGMSTSRRGAALGQPPGEGGPRFGSEDTPGGHDPDGLGELEAAVLASRARRRALESKVSLVQTSTLLQRFLPSASSRAELAVARRSLDRAASGAAATADRAAEPASVSLSHRSTMRQTIPTPWSRTGAIDTFHATARGRAEQADAIASRARAAIELASSYSAVTRVRARRLDADRDLLRGEILAGRAAGVGKLARDIERDVAERQSAAARAGRAATGSGPKRRADRAAGGGPAAAGIPARPLHATAAELVELAAAEAEEEERRLEEFASPGLEPGAMLRGIGASTDPDEDDGAPPLGPPPTHGGLSEASKLPRPSDLLSFVTDGRVPRAEAKGEISAASATVRIEDGRVTVSRAALESLEAARMDKQRKMREHSLRRKSSRP